MPEIRGKVVVITGASSGIGAATAIELARRGAKLVIGARRTDRLHEVAQKCRDAATVGGNGTANAKQPPGNGCNVVALPADVTRRADVDALVNGAVSHFGRLDVMIANAGFGLCAKVLDTTDEQFDEIVATNLKGTLYAMQAAARVMIRQEPHGTGRSRRGHIIAISSGAGRRGLPLYGAYSLTKAGQLSLAEALRIELKSDGIYVSTVHPLTTATEFFDVASVKSRIKSTGVGRPQAAEVVARKLANLIRRPRPELWPVRASALALSLATIFPRLADRGMEKTVMRRKR